ncbi:hypothetical protein [Candidatus Similichlamydia epinepheli]|uniref:hypothetical protein n=1 Tax=Candidatus Similichlamydia epinepheli TaxID=1903953 RepID=UPI0013009B92|nr:hypothetical protein [Candidatus Similichlamydia epinepheli]
MFQFIVSPLMVSFFREPLKVFLSLIPLILVRDLCASSGDMAWLTVLKTVSPFLGFLGIFACSVTKAHTHPVYLIGFLGITAHLPFFSLFFLQATPTIILSILLIYFSVMKTLFPYWVETLHVLYQEKRFKVWTKIQSYEYLLSIFLAPFFGWVLDRRHLSFSSLLLQLTLWSLFGLVIQVLLVNKECSLQKHFKKDDNTLLSISELFPLFWGNMFLVRFHVIFFFVGSGMLVFKMIIPLFLAPFKEALTYTKFWAFSLWGRALGGYLVSLVGSNFFCHNPFFALNWLILLALSELACFHFLVASDGKSSSFLGLTFFLDGVVIAGSRLIWDLSPTIFSQSVVSRHYTQLNLFMNGLRGLLIPGLTAFLLSCNQYLNWMIAIFLLYCFGLILAMRSSLKKNKFLN